MSQQFCNLPENLEGVQRGSYQQWQRGHEITWRVVQPVSGFSRSDMEDVCQTAFELWQAVSGVRTKKYNGTANIDIGVDHIDGQYGVLAQAELPRGNQTSGTLRCWFDEGDSWV